VLYDAGGEAWIFRDPALGRDVAVSLRGGV
jgi:hypothetical protein